MGTYRYESRTLPRFEEDFNNLTEVSYVVYGQKRRYESKAGGTTA